MKTDNQNQVQESPGGYFQTGFIQQPELTGVELPAIELLQKMGWKYLSGKAIRIESRTQAPIIEDIFASQLKKLNPWVDDLGVDKALRALKMIHEEDLIHSNKRFWEEFIQKSTFQLPFTDKGHTLQKTVRFFDTAEPSNNQFTVVNQFVGKNSEGNSFRPDILLFVNGLPLGVIECKAAHEKLENGISQLLSYQKHFSKHFYYNQICVAINRVSGKYGAINTPSQFYFSYRLEDEEEKAVTELLGDEPTEQDRLLWALFEPSRFVELFRHFVLFEQTDDGLIKKLPRYQQYRAVKKTIQRIKNNTGGVVWHTQGSGKSLTMAYLARQLRAQETGLDNPSILLLTDRIDLDRQITNTFNSVGLHPEQAKSVEGLQKRLTNDYGGIFTSTIQKFQEAKVSRQTPQDDGDTESDNRIVRIEKEGRWFVQHQNKNEEGNWVTEEELEVDFQVLSTKKNFYVLVDEAHRSHYGFVGAFMRASLPNARLIAFTGTPLLKDEKNTLKEFGGDDYIDVYALQEAVKDGFTLPIRYLDGISELTVNGLLDKEFEEKFGDLPEAKKALMKQKLLRERRHTEKRYRQIAANLVEHYEQNGYAKGFKAMLVCEGRPSAVKYKEILDEMMKARKQDSKPVFESRVIISLGGITANRSSDSFIDGKKEKSAIESIEERVRNAIKDRKTPIAVPSEEIPKITNTLFKLPFGDESENEPNQNPKFNNIAILIVSDMLLTGYDAPVLNTLYLDKPLREHTLLQAIARVNRTRKAKNAGYIVDYYGIVPDLDKALELYGGDVKPSDLMNGPEVDIPKLQAACEKIQSMLPKKYDLKTQPEKYKTDAEKVLDPARYLDKAENFLEALKQFNKLLDMVLPDPKGAPFQPYFKVFNELKITLKNAMKDSEHQESVSAEESKLLKDLLEKHIKADPVVSLLNHEVSIFDRKEFDELKKLGGKSKAALVMKNQLKQTITAGKSKEPGFFGSLEKELIRLIEEEQEERITQLSFLEQMESMVDRIKKKDEQAQDAGFDSEESIAVFNYLNEKTPQIAPDITRQLFEIDDFKRTIESPNWQRTPTLVEKIEKIIRKQLRGVTGWDRAASKQHAKKMVERLMAK